MLVKGTLLLAEMALNVMARNSACIFFSLLALNFCIFFIIIIFFFWQVLNSCVSISGVIVNDFWRIFYNLSLACITIFDIAEIYGIAWSYIWKFWNM